METPKKLPMQADISELLNDINDILCVDVDEVDIHIIK